MGAEFAQVEAEPLQEQLRQMAISLLCGMVHSTWSTRMALWNCNGLHTLLDLLKEEVSLRPTMLLCSLSFLHRVFVKSQEACRPWGLQTGSHGLGSGHAAIKKCAAQN